MIQATARAAVFVRSFEDHALWAQYNCWQDRKIVFTDMWPDKTSSDCSSLLFYWSCLVTCTVSALVWLVPVAEAKWSAHLKNLQFDVVVKTFCVVSGVANPSPAPALNIFNSVKLEKCIAFVYALILTAQINIFRHIYIYEQSSGMKL